MLFFFKIYLRALVFASIFSIVFWFTYSGCNFNSFPLADLIFKGSAMVFEFRSLDLLETFLLIDATDVGPCVAWVIGTPGAVATPGETEAPG
mgnify:CR=1 FL=1